MAKKQRTSGDEPSLSGQHPPQSDDVRLGGDAALVHLINSLTDSDPEIRKRAAFMLANRGDERAYDALIRLYHEGDRSLHFAIMRALGKLSDKRATSLIIERLEDQNEKWSVRTAAAEALGALRDRRAVEPLITQLELTRRNRPKKLTHAIVSALIELHDPRAIPALLHILPDRLRRYIEPDCVEAILQFVRLLKGDQLIPDLLYLAENGDRVSRHALYHLRDQRAVPTLLRLLADVIEHDKDFIREGWWITEAVGAIGTPEAVDGLVALLEKLNVNRSEKAAQQIVSALGTSRDKRVIDLLLARFNAPLTWYVADALVDIGDRHVIEAVIMLLHNARDVLDDDVEEACIHVLGHLGDLKTLPEIEASMRSTNDYVRRRAVYALGLLGLEEAVTPLLAALRDEEQAVRKETLEAIVKYYLLDERVPPAIMSALNDEYRENREYSARILGDHRETRAVQALIARLETEHAWVYRTVRKSLRQIGTPEALAAIEAARRTHD